MQLQESGEMYLETIYILTQQSSNVRSIDVCEYMGFSKPSVSRAVGLLKSGGYINVDKDGYLYINNKEENFIYHSAKNTPAYSKMLEDDGEADCVYSGPGWPGHLAFIDPVEDWYKPTMEEYLEQLAKN